jgi:hypothetical protein
VRLGDDQRERALTWLEEGVSSRVVAQRTGCSVRTVQRLARRPDAAATAAGRRRDAGASERRETPNHSLRARTPRRDDELDGKDLKATGDSRAVTRKACGAIVGVIWQTVSVALTGTMQLAATNAERRDIGGSLSDALEYFPEESPVVRVFRAIGLWGGVIDGLATSVYRRVIYVARQRRAKCRNGAAIGSDGSALRPSFEGIPPDHGDV